MGVKISNLPSATVPLTGAELVPVVQGGVTAKAQVFDLLSGSNGSGSVGFLQSGTGATARTVESKLRDVVSVKDFGAVGDGVTDDTVAIQAAITAVGAAGGGTVYFPDGDYLTSSTLTMSSASVCLALSHNAGIIYNVAAAASYTCVNITGARCSIVGGLARGFIGPSAWNGTNVTPTFAVILVNADGCYIKTRLYNVYKVGIWFKDCTDGLCEDSTIVGNYPSGSWTGIETVHYGVLFDPSAAASGGNFRLADNSISSCVQGCMVANYGTGVTIRGFVATGNIFDGCWNHGIYSNFTNGAAITGNNFNRCQIGVVVSGDDNVVAGNSFYTATSTAGDARDVTGISVRDGSRNVITGNTIKGVYTATSPVCITLQDVNGIAGMNDNVVSDNTIYMTDGTGIAIRIQCGTYSASRNVIQGNTIVTTGATSAVGAITIYGLAAGGNFGNKVLDNSIRVTSAGEGVMLHYCTASESAGNTYEVAYNAGSATNHYNTWVVNSTNCTVQRNTTVVQAANGANITCYGFRESSTSSSNRMLGLIDAVNTSGGATYSPVIYVSNSLMYVDQWGNGAPTMHARIGSLYRRLDGGAGTTLYIKESGTDATGWVGK